MGDNLVHRTGVTPFKTSWDNEGRYMSYCSYKRHQGLLSKEEARKCEEKGCEHYRVYRESRR